MFKKIQFNLIVTTLTCGLYVVPILQDLLLRGWQRIFNYYAADTFYYLTVARNYGQFGFFTFDGRFPTNGFHPLWQVFTGISFQLGKTFRFSEPIVMINIFLLCVFFNTLALGLIARAFQNGRGIIPVWLVGLPVGIYALLLAPFETRFGTLWSFTNVMETSTVILGYSLLLWLVSRSGWLESYHSATLTGLTLSWITLARLDHGLLALAVGIGVLGLAWVKKSRQILKMGIIAGTILMIVLAIYLIVNQVTTGLWLPVSGSTKSTFPDPVGWSIKISEIQQVLTKFGRPDFGASLWRYTQIILPLFLIVPVLGLWIYRILRRRLDPLLYFWGITGIFVVLLGLYNFLYVPTYDQGHWYFPVSIMWMSLVCIDGLGKIQVFERARGWLTAGMIIGGILFYGGVYQKITPNERYAILYNERSLIQNHFVNQTPQIVEYDDGIIAFTSELETMSGFGFCLDAEASQAERENHLLDLAYSRGYRFIASYYYFGSQFSAKATPEEISTYLQNMGAFIHQIDLKKYVFTIEYQGIGGKFTIFRMERQP
jgi:hypothetical protein